MKTLSNKQPGYLSALPRIHTIRIRESPNTSQSTSLNKTKSDWSHHSFPTTNVPDWLQAESRQNQQCVRNWSILMPPRTEESETNRKKKNSTFETCLSCSNGHARVFQKTAFSLCNRKELVLLRKNTSERPSTSCRTDSGCVVFTSQSTTIEISLNTISPTFIPYFKEQFQSERSKSSMLPNVNQLSFSHIAGELKVTSDKRNRREKNSAPDQVSDDKSKRDNTFGSLQICNERTRRENTHLPVPIIDNRTGVENSFRSTAQKIATSLRHSNSTANKSQTSSISSVNNKCAALTVTGDDTLDEDLTEEELTKRQNNEKCSRWLEQLPTKFSSMYILQERAPVSVD